MPLVHSASPSMRPHPGAYNPMQLPLLSYRVLDAAGRELFSNTG